MTTWDVVIVRINLHPSGIIRIRTAPLIGLLLGWRSGLVTSRWPRSSAGWVKVFQNLPVLSTEQAGWGMTRSAAMEILGSVPSLVGDIPMPDGATTYVMLGAIHLAYSVSACARQLTNTLWNRVPNSVRESKRPSTRPPLMTR